MSSEAPITPGIHGRRGVPPEARIEAPAPSTRRDPRHHQPLPGNTASAFPLIALRIHSADPSGGMRAFLPGSQLERLRAPAGRLAPDRSRACAQGSAHHNIYTDTVPPRVPAPSQIGGLFTMTRAKTPYLPTQYLPTPRPRSEAKKDENRGYLPVAGPSGAVKTGPTYLPIA